MHFLVTGSSPVFELPVASFIAIPPGQRGRGEQDGTGQERFGEPVPAERVPQCAKRDQRLARGACSHFVRRRSRRRNYPQILRKAPREGPGGEPRSPASNRHFYQTRGGARSLRRKFSENNCWEGRSAITACWLRPTSWPELRPPLKAVATSLWVPSYPCRVVSRERSRKRSTKIRRMAAAPTVGASQTRDQSTSFSTPSAPRLE